MFLSLFLSLSLSLSLSLLSMFGCWSRSSGGTCCSTHASLCPSPIAKHGGRFGMTVLIDRAFTKNFHAQFSLPHFMTRLTHSGYQLTFWAKLTRASAPKVSTEIVFLDVDEGYQWIGGAEIELTAAWQHFAMEPVYTTAAQRGHEIQIAFLLGLKVAEFAFDDIELYELDVLSPPPPSPPPPPNYLLWLDAEGGPKGVQTVVATGITQGKDAEPHARCTPRTAAPTVHRVHAARAAAPCARRASRARREPLCCAVRAAQAR